MIWYFHLFWNLNWKEIMATIRKKLKTNYLMFGSKVNFFNLTAAFVNLRNSSYDKITK